MPPQQAVSSRRSLDTMSMWALFSTLVIALFAVFPSSALPSATLKTFVLGAGALITLALYILARLGRGNIVFPSSALVGVLWLPVLAYVLSALFSGTSFMSAFWGSALETDTLGAMLIAAALGTLSALVLRRPEQYGSFLRAAGYAFGVFVAFQLLTILIGQFAPNTISPLFTLAGTFTDLAAVLGLGVVLILVTLRSVDLALRSRRLLMGAGVIGLVLLAISNSALVWALLALVSLGFFVESVMRRAGKSGDSDLDASVVMDETPVAGEEGAHSLVLPLAVLAVSLFFLIGGTVSGALANALHVNVVNVRPSWQSTFTVGQKVYGTSPVFGSGPGSFAADWVQFRDSSLNSTIFWNTDFVAGYGFIPTTLVTLGLVGALAWIAFLGLFIGLGLRTLIRRTPEDPFVRYVSLVSFIGTLYLFAVAVFEVPSAFVMVLAFVFAGLFISTTRFASEGRQWGIIFSRSPRLGFVIVFLLTILLLSSVVAAYSLVGHYLATTEFASAATELNNGNYDAADEAAQKALTYAPLGATYQLQARIANARLNQIVSSSTMDRATAQKAYQLALQNGVNAAITATNVDPNNYQNWVALGNLYSQAVPLGVTGAYDSAKTAYQKAEMLNPTNPEIPYVLAQLEIANKTPQAAIEDLKRTISLKQDYTPAIFLLSQLQVQQGNLKEALDAALAAAYFTPNNPNILFQIGILYAAQNDLNNAGLALSETVRLNPQFANARYFLAAVYAKLGKYSDAVTQLQAVSDMSADNAKAVEPQLTALKANRNPFPANLLSVPTTTVKP